MLQLCLAIILCRLKRSLATFATFPCTHRWPRVTTSPGDEWIHFHPNALQEAGSTYWKLHTTRLMSSRRPQLGLQQPGLIAVLHGDSLLLQLVRLSTKMATRMETRRRLPTVAPWHLVCVCVCTLFPAISCEEAEGVAPHRPQQSPSSCSVIYPSPHFSPLLFFFSLLITQFSSSLPSTALDPLALNCYRIHQHNITSNQSLITRSTHFSGEGSQQVASAAVTDSPSADFLQDAVQCRSSLCAGLGLCK